ncbi:hypothetical protein JYU34_010981 [Plutella xylostella]|uniref:maleylacetoacetate isomerase n=1 Tax=Plutella xylostella TaxID=51655 RepID=A0ABQ7QG67_PLUXY|nr:hypothetical protein JYU34_010981 [Plutella xylostella]
MASPAVLHGFFASSCTWRVRAALVLKSIPFEERHVDIVNQKTHLSDQYQAVHPAQKVPALEIDGTTLVESMAILQYLEDTRPRPALAPAAPLPRARMREIVETIVSGIQPLQNVGVRGLLGSDEEYSAFARGAARRGLQTLEAFLARSAGQYCVGDQLSMADLCFVPQLFNAVGRLKLDISDLPTISKLYAKLSKEEIFMKTHPRTVKHLSET